jgi:hypothetical protein
MLVSCGGSSSSNSSTPKIVELPLPPLHVISTFPNDKDIFIDINAGIAIKFDAEVEIDSLIEAFTVNNNLDYDLSFDIPSLTAIVTPMKELAPATLYEVTLNSSVKGITVGGLDVPLSFTFRTSAAIRNEDDGYLTAVILDMSLKNNATDTDTRALSQALDIVGIPYFITQNIEEALGSRLIYIASYVNNDTFSSDEQIKLESYIDNGGTLVSRSLSAAGLYSLFGIVDQARKNTRDKMTWSEATDEPTLSYIDDPQEETVSLGNANNLDVIYTRNYTLGDGSALAHYNDGTVSVVKNEWGAGKTYLLGVSFTDVILRNQLNLDFEADRGKLNDYEPTTDTFLLFLRAIYENQLQFATWKHSSPKDTKASLIITHDLDSQSAADWSIAFAELEFEHNISATYNINTHYINDAIDGDFYTMNLDIYLEVINKGHSIGSHSVGHFPDWDDGILFPLGTKGNNSGNYSPYHDGTVTKGGTVYGELEVSKNLLTADLNVMPKTFRSGHLLWHDKQAQVMEELGYKYDSSFSANDVLTSFPYRVSSQNSISSPLSSIYEFPLNISDGISGQQAPQETAALWLKLLEKNVANGSLTVLLIHPNRDYKLEELSAFIKGLPDGLAIENMDDFGDYWTARDQFNYDAKVENNILSLTLRKSVVTHAQISLFVKNGIKLSDLKILSNERTLMNYDIKVKGNGNLIIYNIRSIN